MGGATAGPMSAACRLRSLRRVFSSHEHIALSRWIVRSARDANNKAAQPPQALTSSKGTAQSTLLIAAAMPK